MKKTNLAVIATVATLATFALSTPAYAQSTNSQGTRETLVQRLMKAFKLNEGEVNKVVNQYQTERQAERTQLMEERLTQLVNDGKITSDQKAKILAKHKEMQANRPTPEEKQNMTQEERQAEKQAHRAELEEWAQANGIDLQYMFMFGRDRHGYAGMDGGKGMMGRNAQ
jgi:hypothetical protein